MKKILSVVLTFVILIAVFSIGAVNITAADNVATISVDTVSCEKGETIAVNVNISNNPGVIAMHMKIGYDSTKLRLVSAVDNGLLGERTSIFSRNTTQNPYVLMWEDSLSPTNYSSDGALATLTFEVLETAKSGETPITVTLENGSIFNCDLNYVTFQPQNGSVIIEDEAPQIPTVSVGNASVLKGDTFDVPVTIQNNPGIVAMVLSVGYDSSKLSLEMVTNGDLFGNNTAFFGRNIKSNPYVLTWEDSLSSINYTDDGIIATLRFKVLGTATLGETPITITLDNGSIFNCDLQLVELEAVNGTVDIQQGVSLIPADGSNSVVDEDNKTVYGLSSGLTSVAEYFDVTDDSYDVVAVSNGQCFGTGSVVEIRKSGTLIDTYTVIIFGDVNGDGFCDGQDSVIVSCIANGMLTQLQVGESVWFAADCNHDGAINQLDSDLLNQAGLFLDEVQQTTL